ncbi:MAG: hypothetical protein R3B06_03240 [Kofleriaceae bacterium]
MVLALAAGCNRPRCQRRDPTDASVTTTTQYGNPTGAAGYKVQCSGWYPDWISNAPPTADQRSFQLAQGYPLGVPQLVALPDGKLKIDHYDPYPPANDAIEAPWLPLDPKAAADQPAYLEALKAYLLEGNTGAADVEDDFVAQRNTRRSWFHVPMLTTNTSKRREPRHGLTAERLLRDDEHPWIKNGSGGLRSFAIGAYNWLGGYTIGQVFKDPDPALADPAAARFIEGAFVFKLLFAEYDPAKIEPALDPLVGSPEWRVQDVTTGAEVKVRLLQVDVAVRDADAGPTGWVFATFVYDKAMAAPSPWAKLRPVGLMWGNGIGANLETWLAPGIPSNLAREDGLPYGRAGRLNGPVDNPTSSCLSCHGTAQIIVGGHGNSPAVIDAARGVGLFPPAACTDAEDQVWFRNVVAGAPFGLMTAGGAGCALAPTQPGTPPMYGLDYSLQLADALESALVRDNRNPCAATAEQLRDVAIVDAPVGDAHAMAALRERLSAKRLREFGPRLRQDLPRGLTRAAAAAKVIPLATPPAEQDSAATHQR